MLWHCGGGCPQQDPCHMAGIRPPPRPGPAPSGRAPRLLVRPRLRNALSCKARSARCRAPRIRAGAQPRHSSCTANATTAPRSQPAPPARDLPHFGTHERGGRRRRRRSKCEGRSPRRTQVRLEGPDMSAWSWRTSVAHGPSRSQRAPPG